MEFNSKKYGLKDIYVSIVKSFSDSKIMGMIVSENILKARYGGVKKDRVTNYDRDKAIDLIGKMTKNKDLQIGITALLLEETKDLSREIKLLKNVDEIKKYIDDNSEINLMGLCAYLWNDKNEELNEFADELYEEKVLGKENNFRDDFDSIETEEIAEEKSRFLELMDKSVASLIDVVMESDDKVKNLEEIIKQKDLEILTLKEKLAKKDLIKEIKGISSEIKNVEGILEKNDSKFDKIITELDKKNKEVCNKLSKQSAIIEKAQKKISKNELDLIGSIQNLLKETLKKERAIMLDELSVMIQSNNERKEANNEKKEIDEVKVELNTEEVLEVKNISEKKVKGYDQAISKLFDKI